MAIARMKMNGKLTATSRPLLREIGLSVEREDVAGVGSSASGTKEGSLKIIDSMNYDPIERRLEQDSLPS
jgi:hypothetical protein